MGSLTDYLTSYVARASRKEENLLATQVQYFKYKEDQRHNLVAESQNKEQLSIARGNLEENIRHNVRTEEVSWFNAQENQRHNLVNEDIAWANQHETVRHNTVLESQGFAALEETKRHNRAQESIGRTQARASMIQANASVGQAKAAWLNATTNQYNAVTSRLQLKNTTRETTARVTNMRHQNRVYDSSVDVNRSKARLQDQQSRTETSKRISNYAGAFSSVTKGIGDLYNANTNRAKLIMPFVK
jgi:hypothetical protein